MLVSFPRMLSRTQGFTLGRPHRFTVSPDGTRLVFLRSRGGEDRVRRLWELDVVTGEERLLADPGTHGRGTSAAERARRERQRDRSAGVSGYTTDQGVRVLACTAGEKLYIVAGGGPRELAARTPLTDATVSPDGTAVAYVHDGGLRLIGVDGTDDRALATPEHADITYGLAEHVAAESMDRTRGLWWSPDGRRLAVARVDNSPVEVWHLSDPAEPTRAPTAQRYPRAGTANAVVELVVLDREGGRRTVDFGWADYEYLVDVVWDEHGLLAVVQNRPQTTMRVLAVDPVTGRTEVLAETSDPAWTTIVPGFPGRTSAGSLVWTEDRGETRFLTVGGESVTPPGLQVSSLCAIDGDTVLFTASSEPTERHLWTWSAAEGLRRLTTEPGLHTGSRAGGTTVISSATLSGTRVTCNGRTVKDLALSSPVVPKVSLLRAGRRELRTAVLFPAVWQRGERLPVLMDPYGGPAAQRVVNDRGRFYSSQWFADQGFAVVVADGRGTPGRGPRWEREAHGRSATKLLDDQVEALETVAALYPELDLSRVGIRGWSAGGYLAALAVLRRPDVFHAAVAGAPVTDMRLYDTHWQERYLGDPRLDPTPYEEASLIADAPGLERPLMLIHGLSDDNVYPVHTMRLSAALLAAGKPHTVLPLPGASHMPPDTDLLTPQLRFLRDALRA